MIHKIDAVVLCGGMGKRLRSVIGVKQKTFADLNGKPFLDIILSFLKKQGVRRVILLTGYAAEEIESYYKNNSFGLTISFSREKSPLGTGGAVKNATGLIKSDPFFLLNGDSFCPVDFKALLEFHRVNKSAATIVVSAVKDSRDYGGVLLDLQNRIMAFVEKQPDTKLKNVNAGIYCLSRQVLNLMPKKKKHSIEYDLFPKLIDKNFFGFKTKKKFYDIGTPDRFYLAQKLLT